MFVESAIAMTPEDDVKTMQALLGEIADRLADGNSVKDRVRAVRSTRLSFLTPNRVFEFLCGKARRADGYEKDNARHVVNELRAAERQRKDLEHLAWLESEIARHREAGEELRGPHIDGLLHFLRVGRGEVSAVEVPRTAEVRLAAANDEAAE